MLPQWRSPRSDVASESVYSQPSPPRNTARRPLSSLLVSNFAWPARHRDSSAISPPAPKSPTTTITTCDTPPRLPPLRIGEHHSLESARSPTSRSPTSVRSIIDPMVSPATDNGRPLSPLTFMSSEGPSPIQAPARVLDYGGNVPLDSPFGANTRRSRSGRHARHASSRTQRSLRSIRSARPRQAASVRSVQSYEDRSRGSGNTAAITDTSRRRGARWVPKHSKGKVFFPAMKHAAIRNKFFHAVVSGGLLVLVLVVFLALLGSNSDFTQEFRIIAILFMLVFIVLFAHSLIRLLMLMLQLKKRGTLSRNTSLNSNSTFARPSEPIPVVLARDEELGIGGSPQPDEPKPPPPPPPAYGLWRGSVRVDPNLIHWQRVEQPQGIRPVSAGTVRRPPSYSADGENPDVQVERQIAQEQANATRDHETATRWRPSLPPPPRIPEDVHTRLLEE